MLLEGVPRLSPSGRSGVIRSETQFGVRAGRTAQEILKIIEGAQFSISEPDNLIVSSQSATNALRAGLKSIQPSLSEGDLKAISFFGTLSVDYFADIVASINVGGDLKRCNLLVFTPTG